MRIEDLKNWTVDQLKEEVVRLADEREKKQHVILDLIELNKKLLKNDNCKIPIDGIENIDAGHPSAEWYEQQHRDDCIRINQLQTTIDVLVDRYANLRKITKKLARTEGDPVKEIADFAKTHPYEYMRKCLEQYPYWGNKDNGFNRQKI